VTVHDLNYLIYPETHFGLRALGMRALVPLAVRRSHRTIVPSVATRDDLVERLRASSAAIDVIPQGVGLPPAGAPAAADELRQRLELKGHQVLLTVSAKRPHKNLSRLLGAVARVPHERRPVLVLPGYPTPHEYELRALACRVGIDADVRFLGWVSAQELNALYELADAFVFPSLYEGFGLPVLEAMARSLPVATSGRGSLAEVAGDAALFFDPEREDSIAQAIERLLGDRELREQLSRAGRERAARFSWDATAEATVASYRRALDPWRRGR